jgi:hypothetical protein
MGMVSSQSLSSFAPHEVLGNPRLLAVPVRYRDHSGGDVVAFLPEIFDSGRKSGYAVAFKRLACCNCATSGEYSQDVRALAVCVVIDLYGFAFYHIPAVA